MLHILFSIIHLVRSLIKIFLQAAEARRLAMERGQREVMAGRERRAEEVRAKRVTLREVFRGEY